MKLITSFTAIIAAASAGRIFHQPQGDQFAHAADVYQSAAEQSGGHAQGVYQVTELQGGGHAQTVGHGSYQARPGDAHAQILAYHSESDGHNYQYAYETDNGIKAQESGSVHEGTRAEGGYSYTGDDGQLYSVSYIADEHGFRAAGAHLPTPPPIPHEILQALEQNAKDEAAGIVDDGSYRERHQQGQHYQYENYQQEAYSGAPAQAAAAEGAYHH